MPTPASTARTTLPFLSSVETQSLALLADHWAEVAEDFDDEQLSDGFGLPLEVVARMRREKERGPDTRPSDELVLGERGSAVELIPRAFDPGRQPATVGPEAFGVPTPSYVWREPIRYDLFAFLLARLADDVDVRRETLALAFGIPEDEIERALGVWYRHVASTGDRCRGCGHPTDSRYSEYCSTDCKATEPYVRQGGQRSKAKEASRR